MSFAKQTPIQYWRSIYDLCHFQAFSTLMELKEKANIPLILMRNYLVPRSDHYHQLQQNLQVIIEMNLRSTKPVVLWNDGGSVHIPRFCSKLALNYLAFPVTTVSCQRLISLSGHVVNSKPVSGQHKQYRLLQQLAEHGLSTINYLYE